MQAIANIDNNTIHKNIDVPPLVNRRGDTPQWGWIDSIDNRLQPRKFGRNGRAGPQTRASLSGKTYRSIWSVFSFGWNWDVTVCSFWRVLPELWGSLGMFWKIDSLCTHAHFTPKYRRVVWGLSPITSLYVVVPLFKLDSKYLFAIDI